MPKSAVHQTILHDHTSGIGPIINDRGSQVLRNESVYIYIYVHTKFQKKKNSNQNIKKPGKIKRLNLNI
jgi:hypothetical protein